MAPRILKIDLKKEEVINLTNFEYFLKIADKCIVSIDQFDKFERFILEKAYEVLQLQKQSKFEKFYLTLDICVNGNKSFKSQYSKSHTFTEIISEIKYHRNSTTDFIDQRFMTSFKNLRNIHLILNKKSALNSENLLLTYIPKTKLEQIKIENFVEVPLNLGFLSNYDETLQLKSLKTLHIKEHRDQRIKNKDVFTLPKKGNYGALFFIKMPKPKKLKVILDYKYYNMYFDHIDLTL